MKPVIETLEKSEQGWDVTIKVELESDQLRHLDESKLKKIEDWEIFLENNFIYFKGELSTSEPWEDEPIEELVNSTLHEVEWRLLNLFK